MKIVIKGTDTVEQYKSVYSALQAYGEDHGAQEMRWEWGTISADGEPVRLEAGSR